jgi:hypothetical protein
MDIFSTHYLYWTTGASEAAVFQIQLLADKVDYQLYFFFEYGNAEAFLALYEAHPQLPLFSSHIKAAIVYASLHQFSNAQDAIERYFQTAFDYRPLEPFLDNVLIDVMTENFTKKMLLQFKQNSIQQQL